MFKHILIGLGAALFVSAGANAGTVAGVNLSDDGKKAVFAEDAGHFMPAPQHDKGTKVIFSNIGTKYPKGEYFCCFGDTISGSTSITGAQSWVAAQFASLDDIKVTEIDVAAEWADGTNEIAISLYTDKNGIPDKLLKTFTVTGLQGVSGCCGLAIGKDSDGIPIKGGRPYWVAVTTPASDTFAVWADNTTDEIYGLPIAENSGSGWAYAGYQIPQLSFGVFGQ
ncbi:MAG TPA: choice-of-anchor R domain-containing protein [Rhizomicrobium sp.]|jgi:hypothetical protein